jgi:SOS response regulatory protein OraA/RecX
LPTDSPKRGAKGPRKPRAMTETRLRNIATWYCQRYLVSSAKLSDHLEKRLRREVADVDARRTLSGKIPEIVQNLAGLGLVNDREAASARLRSALRSGYAPRAAVNVAARGAMVGRDLAESELGTAIGEALPELLREEDEAPASSADQAALALKRARRGPWRSRPQDEASKRRDAGWLQRRGFPLDAVRAALDIDPEDE